jgi:hypothetical protein
LHGNCWKIIEFTRITSGNFELFMFFSVSYSKQEFQIAVSAVKIDRMVTSSHFLLPSGFYLEVSI